MRDFHLSGVVIGALAALSTTVRAQDKPPAAKAVVTYSDHAAGVVGLAFTPDGKHVVSVSPTDIRSWDIPTGKQVAGWDALRGGVIAVAPNGRAVAFTSTKPSGRSVAIRTVADGKVTRTIQAYADVTKRAVFGPLVGAMAFSPNGKRLAIAGRSGLVGGPHGYPGGVVTVWSANTGKRLLHCFGPREGVSTSSFAMSIAFSANGKYIAAGTSGAGGELPESSEVVIWDAKSGKVVRAIKVRQKVRAGGFNSPVTAVALSPEGNLVAAAYGNRTRGPTR